MAGSRGTKRKASSNCSPHQTCAQACAMNDLCVPSTSQVAESPNRGQEHADNLAGPSGLPAQRGRGRPSSGRQSAGRRGRNGRHQPVQQQHRQQQQPLHQQAAIQQPPVQQQAEL